MATDDITKRFLAAQDRLVVQASDLSLGALADMVDSGVIDTEPRYQRRERWSPAKRSALIESFLLNVPVPPVYLAEDEYGKYSIVDGKQRLTTIASFMKGKFRLSSLESFHSLEGLRFENLPDPLRNALLVRPYLRVITLLKQSDPLLKYEVFVRLNRGGESMEPQELRNVAFRGKLNDLIFELSESAFLKKQLKIKDKASSAYRAMVDAELVLRYLTLRETWSNFSGALREAMDSFMAARQSMPARDTKRYRAQFSEALDRCEALWDDLAFKRPKSGGLWRDQFLNGMFDAQMLAVSELTAKEFEKAKAAGKRLLVLTRGLFKDREFDRAVREATNTPKRIEYRVRKTLEMLRSL